MPEPEYDVFEELGRVLAEAGLTPCFWRGDPPCPKCGGSHGFPGTKVESAPWVVARRKIEQQKAAADG